MSKQAKRDIRRKLKILNHARETGNISKTCRYFGISREIFYQWKRSYDSLGETALINSKPCPENRSIRVPQPIEEKILHLRKTYHFGAQRIAWYLDRYHSVKVSSGGVQGVLRRHGINRLPQNMKSLAKRNSYQLYEKQVPGHHVQIDVKFLKFIDNSRKTIKRFQYTAIDDATRIRVLKAYKFHNQRSSIDFANLVIRKMPFRIKVIRTDNGHEFQAQFHWHLQDLGISHIYIKPRTPRLNGKVERSHRIDDQEFYQLLEYKDDVDLEKKMTIWENFYNFQRPHGAHVGKTPYEALREKLSA
jgi:transposase InsO family protein